VTFVNRSIHLSNNSVQKHFSSSPNRSDKLPVENMWTSDEFDRFLRFVLCVAFVVLLYAICDCISDKGYMYKSAIK